MNKRKNCQFNIDTRRRILLTYTGGYAKDQPADRILEKKGGKSGNYGNEQYGNQPDVMKPFIETHEY